MNTLGLLHVPNEDSRAAVNADLTKMAVEVRLHIMILEERQHQTGKQLRLAIEYRPSMTLPYQLEIQRLERIIARHRETYEDIVNIASMVDSAGYRELRQSISFLKNDTWHWFGFNLGRLPGRIHSLARDALLHLN